jgi:hypothetical protein
VRCCRAGAGDELMTNFSLDLGAFDDVLQQRVAGWAAFGFELNLFPKVKKKVEELVFVLGMK